MKMNPQMLRALVKKGCSQCVATSRYVLRRIGPIALQDKNDLSTFDESILQQDRFWLKSVTWTLIGTTVFGIGWLAIARTEEVVVAMGKLEPVGDVKEIRIPPAVWWKRSWSRAATE